MTSGEIKSGAYGSHQDYRTWRTYDEYYNREEMWPATEYPDADLHYMSEAGCYVVSLCIMMRMSGIVAESDFQKFNPLIFCEKLKSGNGFFNDGSVNVEKLPEIFPLRIVDSIPYNRDDLASSLSEGYACQIIVKGRNAPQHYVVPVKVTESDVEIIDPSWDKTRLSELEPIWIVRYLKNEEITNRNL